MDRILTRTSRKVNLLDVIHENLNHVFTSGFIYTKYGHALECGDVG